MFFREFLVVYGSIDGNHFTLWYSTFTTSVFYPLIIGEISDDGRVKVILKINLIGKIIYFLFAIFIIGIFSALMIKGSTSFDQYLLTSGIILIISTVTFYLGYLGNKVFKSISLREFNEYLNRN